MQDGVHVLVGAPKASAKVRRTRGLARAFLALLVTFGLGYGLLTQAHWFVKTLPATAKLFAAVGHPVNLVGLDLSSVTARLVEDGPGRLLAIRGDIANIESHAIKIPDLKLAVMTGDRQLLYTWTVPAPKARLAVGETVPFQARLISPPSDGEAIQIGFVTAGESAPQLKGPK